MVAMVTISYVIRNLVCVGDDGTIITDGLLIMFLARKIIHLPEIVTK